MITKPASAMKKLGAAKQGAGAFARPYADITNMAGVLRHAIKPAAPGVVLVHVPDPTVLLYARVAIERDIIQRHPVADVPMPAVTTLTALYSDQSRRDADFSKHFHSSGQFSKALEVVSLTSCKTLNCLSSEGATLLLNHVDDKTCATAQQTIPNSSPDEVARVLAALKASAKERDSLIVLFLHGADHGGMTWMQQHVNELLIVRKCDPSPGASTAFSLEAESLGGLRAIGIGHTMYELSFTPSWKQEQQVFIAADMRDRLMWLLRREGESVSDIAGYLEVDKSTVSKRLKSLPLPPDTTVPVNMPKGWREKWFEQLGLDSLPSAEANAVMTNTAHDTRASREL